MEVYVNHSPLFRRIGRLFQRERRTNLFVRAILGIPGVLEGFVLGKLFRADHYDPLTESIVTYTTNLGVTEHEIGHAEDYDRSRHPTIKTFTYSFPGVRSLFEWNASNYAMKHMNTQEREKARKVLEPAFGSYAGADTAIAFLPFAEKNSLIAPLVGLVAGHIHSRMKGTKNIFFDEDYDKSLVERAAPVGSPAFAPAMAH